MASALPLSSGLAVGRVRLSGPGGSRALLEQALGEVAVDRLGLGPEEVLYIPRLAGPARLRTGATRHFAHGLDLVLGDIARRAERDPVGGSASDQPCRFSSRAAFAAWLIGCVLDTGTAEGARVVRAATGRASAADWWRHDALGDGRRLVPVLVRLVAAGKAVRWLRRLDTAEIAWATSAMTRDYGLMFPPDVDRDAAAGQTEGRQAAMLGNYAASGDGDRRAMAERVRAVGEAIARRDKALAELSGPARRLLVAALVLARWPACPRATLAWAIAQEPWAASAATLSPAVVTAARSEAVQGIDPHPTTPAPMRQSEPVLPPTRSPHVPIITVLAPDRAAPTPVVGNPAPTARGVAAPAQARAAQDVPPLPSAAWNPFADPSDPPDPVALSAPQTAFDTAFGGLAFLVNAFLAMGLYPDFTRPLDPALALPPLALADRLGLHWFGARYRRDPLHRWIARCGGRGALPRRWRVEREWLVPFPLGRAWHDGSVLRHTAGFPLATPIAAMPARRLARQLGVARIAGGAGRSSRKVARDPAWIECLALFLAARFRRAAPDRTLTPDTLATPGRIVVGEARLDVHFALDALPIALRLAGLDRDPGWLPSEGRDVRFHFA